MDPFAPCPPHPQQALMCFTLLPKNSRAWAEVVYEEEKVAVPTEGLIFAPRSGLPGFAAFCSSTPPPARTKELPGTEPASSASSLMPNALAFRIFQDLGHSPSAELSPPPPKFQLFCHLSSSYSNAELQFPGHCSSPAIPQEGWPSFSPIFWCFSDQLSTTGAV